MTLSIASKFEKLDAVRIHRGLTPAAFERLEHERAIALPAEHKELLEWSNGLETYAGYFRLFGAGSSASIDACLWNQHEHWKFAWGEHCSAYWCFGETAWGDQYAYSIASLSARTSSEVYFLDAFSMAPEVISPSFGDFLEAEFLRSARDPYDDMTRLARKKLGPLDPSLHLVYMPSLLLSGTELIDNVQTMNSRAAMICNGDLAIQLDTGPADGKVSGVEVYQDSEGRMRVRVLWA